jgi:hypothetical protein
MSPAATARGHDAQQVTLPEAVVIAQWP